MLMSRILMNTVGATLPVGIPDMEQDLHNLPELSYLATSLFPFGCGVIPLFTAPLSVNHLRAARESH